MNDFTCAGETELQLVGIPFDQADLIAFCECNHMLIDDVPDPVLCGEVGVDPGGFVSSCCLLSRR